MIAYWEFRKNWNIDNMNYLGYFSVSTKFNLKIKSSQYLLRIVVVYYIQSNIIHTLISKQFNLEPGTEYLRKIQMTLMSFQLFLSYASKQCITSKALKHKKEMWLLKILDTFSLFERFFKIMQLMYVILNIQIILKTIF